MNCHENTMGKYFFVNIGPELLNVSIRRIRLYSHILLNKKIDVYFFIK